jgi:hypothetical protein
MFSTRPPVSSHDAHFKLSFTASRQRNFQRLMHFDKSAVIRFAEGKTKLNVNRLGLHAYEMY